MRSTIRKWLPVARGVAVVVLAGVLVFSLARGRDSASAAAADDGQRHAESAVTQTPSPGSEQRQKLRELRAEHRAEMKKWCEKYGGDPSSAEAQRALTRIREEHRAEMTRLRDKLGLECPCDGDHRRGRGRRTGGPGAGGPGAGGCRNSGGGMMGWGARQAL